MKSKSWAPIDPKKWDIWDLEEARYQFWLGDYKKTAKLIFPLCSRLVQEPLVGTQEYEDGQGKPPESVNEPETEKGSEAFEDWTIPAFLEANEERDDDGYLIR